MRCLLLSLVFPSIMVLSVWAGGPVHNYKEFREIIMAGHRPLEIKEASQEMGCRPQYCSIDTDDLSILYERELIQRSDGKQLRLEQHGPGTPNELPNMDWSSNKAFKIFRSGKRWGACIWFSNEGIGKSGYFQRWKSIVLVPWKGSHPGLVAHRFMGYWATCDSLVEGDKEGEVMMPIIEPEKIGAGQLQLVWFHCTAKGCTKVKDKRTVSGSADSESGEIVIK